MLCLTSYLSTCRTDLIKNGKEGYFFQQLCRDLAWDSLVKHKKWLEAEDDSNYEALKNSGENFIRVAEAQIIKRLIAYYLNNLKENDYLAGSGLFIKYANLAENRRNSGYWEENIKFLSPYQSQELVDPCLIEYACTGFYDEQSGKRKKVIVLTCDFAQENRVKRTLTGKKKIDEELAAIGIRNESLVPGYIIIIDPQKHEEHNIINIASCL